MFVLLLPKPPKPVDVPDVAVLLPNIPPAELVFVPKPDALPPKGAAFEAVAPKPKSLALSELYLAPTGFF